MLILLFLVVNSIVIINTLDHHSENANSCVDSCSEGFNVKYRVNLSDGSEEIKDTELVEVLDRLKSEVYPDTECSKNVLLRIPFHRLNDGVVARIELEYGEIARGTTIHIGNSPTNDLNGGDRDTTLHNAEIYSNETNFSYYMSSLNLCDQQVPKDASVDLSRLLLLNDSQSFINPKSKIAIYVTEKWFRIDSLDRNSTLYYNNDYLFNFGPIQLSEQCEKSPLSQLNKLSPYLYIGLNRVIADEKVSPGSGLCNAEISFLNCFTNPEPDVDINVTELKYKLNDMKNISWVNPLSYLETSVMEHAPCSAQGVLKLTYDPANMRKIARFDLDFGEILSGFTFNIGDSPTNNAYGGDTGTTSNSAEIHSNDNRFYVWLNTKYCGDTLLYKIEYNLFQSYDKLTFFISDQRIEVTNHKNYHEILKSPYLYNINGQNVTCNCFDTRCYAGVATDYDVYFGINRVIGGTYRPGVGLCNAKISWLRCGGEVKSVSRLVNSDYVDWLSTTTTVTTTTAESTTTESSTSTTTTTTTATTSTPTTTTEVPTTEETETTTINILDILKNSTIDILKEVNEEVEGETEQDVEEKGEEKGEEEEVDEEIEEDEKILGRILKGRLQKGRPLLIKQNVTLVDQDPIEAIPVKEENENYAKYCTEENINKNLIYHEHRKDSSKFIYCEQVNRAIILLCPLNMKWSQAYLQCLQLV